MGIFNRRAKKERKQFLDIIEEEYSNLSQTQISKDLINAVSKRVADYYYNQYQTFKKQYPKSQKRYSTFQIKDLDHPYTYEIIIKVLKEKVGTDYEKYATIFLQMTLNELKKFEKSREEFYDMF
ncbi:hypothetical protein [Aureivirga marina]|uniref:hypothetical protein n=1 Tax=Aureivirga marina TaxID=1182451 RepID=UPI0018CA6EBE|nr:hypothetical protein [Aureivirga marina]